MDKKEEKSLLFAKEKYDTLKIPDDIDRYIEKGIRKAKIAKSRKQISKWGSIAASSILIMLITAVRISPVFASYIRQVPGLMYIVEWIRYDKGLVAAIENEFIESVDVFDEKENIRFSIESIIMDRARMIIFYALENKGELEWINLDEITFKNQDGERLEAGVHWGHFSQEEQKANQVLRGMVEVNFVEEAVIPAQIYVDVKLRFQDVKTFKTNRLLSTWSVVLPIDKEKFENLKKEYVLNQVIQIEDQRIELRKVMIYPTRTELEIRYDPANSKQIFCFEDIRFVDETGETWATIQNGITGKRENLEERLYFQSNYFTTPRELYLVGSTARAIDKDLQEVQIDLKNETMSRAPDDRIRLDRIRQVREGLQLEFSLTAEDKRDEQVAYNIFQYSFQDIQGKEYAPISMGVGSSYEGKQESIYTIKAGEPYNNPIILTIRDYPMRIHTPFRIQIQE